MKKFLKEWQDALFWVPLAVALLVLVTALLPRFDPMAGVDGLGFLQGYAALLLKGGLITFSAWMCKRTYTIDWSDADEIRLVQTAQQGAWPPYLIDRLEWAMWLALWCWIFSE